MVAFLAAVLTVKRLLYVCQPNEVLIFSGRRRAAAGQAMGYRIVRGGSALRVPLLETADRMDLTNMIIDVKVTNAYSKGGIPLTVQGIANIKIPGGEPLLSNTLERFLGKVQNMINEFRDTMKEERIKLMREKSRIERSRKSISKGRPGDRGSEENSRARIIDENQRARMTAMSPS